MTNHVFTNLLTRRSVRKYLPAMPPQEDLDKIVEAGIYAASGKNLQSSIIVAVTDPTLRNRLSDLNRRALGAPEGTDPFFGAPVVFAVLADRNARTYICDGSLTIGNMLLAAHELGLGSLWVHRAKEVFASEEGKAILRDLGISGDYEGIGHCVVGYTDGEEPQPSPRREGRVFWVK